MFRPKTANNEHLRIINPITQELSTLAELTVKDIFQRLDKIRPDQIVEYPEYQEFFGRINQNISKDEFNRVLRDNCTDGKEGLSKRGFLQMFKKIAQSNETKAWKLLRAWGYDEDLYSVEGRSFVMTVQSLWLISLSYEEATLLEDYEDLVNRMVI